MEQNTNKENKGNVKVPLIALIKKQRKLIFDSSSLNNVGFEKFIERNGKLARNSRGAFFIPNFVSDLLTEKSKSILQELVASGAFRTINCQNVTNFTNLVPLIKEMSKERGQLCFVSNSASVSKAILIAFKKESIFVQFFFLDSVFYTRI